MNHLSKLAGLALAATVLAGLAPATTARADKAVEPYPIEYWALREVVRSVQVSPNGKYLAAIKIPTRDGDPLIDVYLTDDLSKEPFTFGSDKMEITGYYWVGNHDMIVTFRQQVRDKIDGFNQGVYENKIALLDVEDKEYTEFRREVNPTVSHVLPKKPNKVILSFNPTADGIRVFDRAFRPRAYYEFDLERQTKRLLLQGSIGLGQVEFNEDGEPWFGRGFDASKGEFIWFYREPGTTDWKELYRLHESSLETFQVEGVDPDNPGKLLVVAHNGRDTAGLWEFDIATGQFGELIYARNDVNVAGTGRHSNDWEHMDKIVSVAYRTDKLHREFFDAEEKALFDQLQQVVPNAWDIYITSRSKDGGTMTVFNTGPRDPGTYYLIDDGKMAKIGSQQPLLEPEKLADVKYITYKARDGMDIHGFVTIPHGEPPFPLVVLPHGGPFVSEVVGYDEWGQLLANNGYMVLQPQYRGSTNFGIEYYAAAWKEGGQGGYKMQDDKDDGAMYLVEQGLADPDRLAMFGWSYGGYAALIAAARTPQIYQCVVAGAAVSDNLRQVTYYENLMRDDSVQRAEQMAMWTDSISPVDVADQVNVPLLLIHGSVDQRVPPEHQRRYTAALDKAGKSYEYIELDGADHFSNTLFYDHQLSLYTNMIRFLKEDCGPGGL